MPRTGASARFTAVVEHGAAEVWRRLFGERRREALPRREGAGGGLGVTESLKGDPEVVPRLRVEGPSHEGALVGGGGLLRGVRVEEGVAEQPVELGVGWGELQPTVTGARGTSGVAEREAHIGERRPDLRQLADRGGGRGRRIAQQGDEDRLGLPRGVALAQQLG